MPVPMLRICLEILTEIPDFIFHPVDSTVALVSDWTLCVNKLNLIVKIFTPSSEVALEPGLHSFRAVRPEQLQRQSPDVEGSGKAATLLTLV